MNPVTTPEKQIQSGTSAKNPLLELQKQGQSVWLDYIRRDLITSGELKRLIDEDGLRGITSNPSIFEKAIAGSTDYAGFLDQLRGQGLSSGDIYERIAVRDIQDAADLLLPVYKATNKHDGYVSLEVSPTLARDTKGTIEEARRLWKTVGRPNIMIKVPGTDEGAPAVRQLISEGININITLLFAQESYVKVAQAYIDGLEAAQKAGTDIRGIAGVASFFVSRIDSLVDSLIDERLKTATSSQDQDLLRSLHGKVAIANAKQAYRSYQQMIAGQRWKALAAKGAQVQRLLWASTGTKDPKVSDTLYIKALAAPFTINTMPENTLKAFADHGEVGELLAPDGGDCERVLASFAQAGIGVDALAAQLQNEGAASFVKSWNDLMACVESKSAAMRKVS